MNNGHEESRLDRIEGAMEALVRSQSHRLEAQSGLERDHRLLLQAQVLLQDQLNKFISASGVNKGEAEKRMAEHEKGVDRIELNLAEATGKINALINLMDRHLDEHRRREQ